ncbi:thiamine-phosphate kinase [Brevibacterium senegalense]|uniref:thiamine-phosphate kinase n=1 Tax=Brevibacterium senegalense TaxID=1033736 RepID=UPI0003161876|nr:AIR synthase related protein [Brevibacterium senegalense]
MTSAPTFAQLGEDALIARILARIPRDGTVVVGPGDDAAVTEAPGRLVSSADMLVEGEDFLDGWLDARRLGVKAAAQNLADVRAMGARPTGLLLSLAAPGDTPASFVDGLIDGLVEEAGRAGAVVLGGDLSDARQIVIAVTALGSLPAQTAPLTRNAARPGHTVWLGGRTGWAAAGLDALFAGAEAVETSAADVPTATAAEAVETADAGSPPAEPGSDPATDSDTLLAVAIEAQRAPRPDYEAVDALREALDGQPGALIDLSDGLGSDAGRLARASGVDLDLDSAALDALADDLVPVAHRVRALEDAARADPGEPVAVDASPDEPSARARARRWVLTGGEDHGFLATVPDGVHPLGWRLVGRVRPVSAAPSVLIDGVPVGDSGFAAVDSDGGFRHFSGSGE